MFEQIIRPFQTAQVLATRRIVKSVSAVAAPQAAILTWGAAGTIPAGVQQKPPSTDGARSSGGGFTVQRAQDNWTQSGTPETETVDVGGAKVKRVRVITFARIIDSIAGPPGGLAAAAVSDVVAGLKAEIEGSRATRSQYKTKWD